MLPTTVFTLLMALHVSPTTACVDEVADCFNPQYTFDAARVPEFCDFVTGEGEQCLIDKNIVLDKNNVNKKLVQCHRLNPTDKTTAHLTWRYLAYCYYNKPNDAIFPECFGQIRQKCSKPSSFECKTACEAHFNALDGGNEFKVAQEEAIKSNAAPLCLSLVSVLTLLTSEMFLF